MSARPFIEADIPAVVQLFQRVFPQHGWSSATACAAYLRAIFLDNPCPDPQLPSWVVTAEGRCVGFAGVMARTMLFEGQPIRVAVDCVFMVDPDMRHSMAALQLAQGILAGPQDLTIADGATDKARQMWAGLGGEAPLGYNLHWIRPLQPARHLLNSLGARWPRALTGLLAPGAMLADAVAARASLNDFTDARDDCLEEPADAATIVTDQAAMFTGMSLHPRYDTTVLAWVLRECAQRQGFGTLRARRVLDAGRYPLGWYIYYLRRGQVSEVLQLVAREGAFDLVLRRLFADAARGGAAALRGRLDPDRAPALGRRHCWMRWEEPATLVHSRHPRILAAIREGRAFMSRLDGEWWLRFVSG